MKNNVWILFGSHITHIGARLDFHYSMKIKTDIMQIDVGKEGDRERERERKETAITH